MSASGQTRCAIAGGTKSAEFYLFNMSKRGDKSCLGVPFAFNKSSILTIVISEIHLAAFLLLSYEAIVSEVILHFLSRSTIHARWAARAFEKLPRSRCLTIL